VYVHLHIFQGSKSVRITVIGGINHELNKLWISCTKVITWLTVEDFYVKIIGISLNTLKLSICSMKTIVFLGINTMRSYICLKIL